MGSKACVNCFALLADGPVCGQCGYDNAAYHPQPHHLPPGVILRNRYVVGKAMGQGGFGITYVGFDTSLKRRVAVKEYFPEGTAIRDAARTVCVSSYSSEAFQKRYGAGLNKCMNEAQSLAKLDDIPGIVRVLDYFQENNTAYVIMEFVEGVTLVTYLRQLPQKPDYREALALLSPIGTALRRIHDRGFVHRDVSPDNIMINRFGEPKLLDFGAVKTVTEGGTPTESPIVKRGFSPHEMYSVKGKIGPWSDVYAYCATLYYILTGTAPEEPIDRAGEDPAGESLSRFVSPAQTAALLKGLAIQPDQRYQTAAEMTAALNACLNDPAPEKETCPMGAPVPETEAIVMPDARKTEPAVAMETKLIVKPAARKTEPAVMMETESIANSATEALPETELIAGSAPKKTDVDKTSGANVPTDDGAVLPSVGGKKKKPVIIAAVTALAALCVIIVFTVSRFSGNTSISPIISATVGDYVKYGKYEQNNNISDGKESIEWIVLAKENGKALLISRYGLDCQPYNTVYTDVTWETCTLRTWLNGTFINSAFSAAEQERIATTTVTADANQDKTASSGNDTADRIFLLSTNEAKAYFNSAEERKCRATSYAESQGAFVYSDSDCWWWLRSHSDYSRSAALVNTAGSIRIDGSYVGSTLGAVRPAMWIDLS